MNTVFENLALRWTRINYQFVFLIAFGVAGGIAAFPVFYLTSSNVLIGLCLFPFAIFVQGARRVNYFYLIGALFFATLSCLFNLKIFYFFTLLFYLIFLIEFFIGRINTLILFLVAVMSPVFLQVVTILGFPIRLYLSQVTGSLLGMAGMNIAVEGNMMVLDGYNFTVDEACMGLHMLVISMLMGVFIISHHYRTFQRRLSLINLLSFFLAVFVLNILSNIFRMVTLVLFRILPEDPLHEVVGIACMIFYVIAPLYFIGRWMVSKNGEQCKIISLPDSDAKKINVSSFGLAVLILSVGLVIKPEKAETIAFSEVALMDMRPEQISGGITKMNSDQLLVYVKPIPEFFTGEHTPVICWRGSGYQFKKIEKKLVDDTEIYCGLLIKDNHVLYTSWWYSNGTVNTIDQITWRSMMMKGGDRFHLVNITSSDENVLQENLNKIFKNNLLVIKNPE
jgi:exosortase N